MAVKGSPSPEQRAALFRAIEARVDGEVSKDDVIAGLASTDWSADAREDFYRRWCRGAQLSVLRSDLERVRAARRRELQRSFEF